MKPIATDHEFARRTQCALTANRYPLSAARAASSPAEIILSKVPLPTHLDSAEIRSRVAREIREKAFFSAQNAMGTYIKQLQQLLGAYAQGRLDASEVRIRARQKLADLGYVATGKGLSDHASALRLNLILRTNTQMAAGMAQRESANDPLLAAAFPAWELVSGGYRKVHRTDWLRRWQAAREAVGWKGARKGRRMVALKSSPIWEALGNGAGGFRDTLGNPYPPFAYGSSYEWSELSRAEAQALGLLKAVENSAAHPQDSAGHWAAKEGEPCTHQKQRKLLGEETIKAGTLALCTRQEASRLLNDGFSIDAEGHTVHFDRFVKVHYEHGLRRKDNTPKPENLELLPVAVYAVKHAQPTVKYPQRRCRRRPDQSAARNPAHLHNLLSRKTLQRLRLRGLRKGLGMAPQSVKK